MTLVTILLILTLPLCFVNEARAVLITAPDKIKVAIAVDVTQIELSIKGPYKITKVQTGEVIKEGEVLWQGKFKPDKDGIRLITFKDEYLAADKIRIMPVNSPSIYVGKSLYRGALQISKAGKGKLTVVNVVALEDYIKGVLYHEISHRWPLEAIKAQAIASRTFAVYQAQQGLNQDYDLRADTRSQMYRGVFAEKYRTNKAADETAGRIIAYRDKVLPAFFHSACGGRTERAANLWKIQTRFKALSGVKCNFCKNSPYFNWQKAVPLNEIRNKLTKAKIRIGKIKAIKILSRNESGRVNALKINDKRSVKLSAKELRNILGSKVLSSANFTVRIKGSKAYFKGYGWGHGVGMCQWGAFSMAKKGYDCYQILEYYYPSIKIVNME